MRHQSLLFNELKYFAGYFKKYLSLLLGYLSICPLAQLGGHSIPYFKVVGSHPRSGVKKKQFGSTRVKKVWLILMELLKVRQWPGPATPSVRQTKKDKQFWFVPIFNSRDPCP